MRALGPACVAKEFAAWATGRTSPVIAWCRALAIHEHERCGGPGVGVVGMCFTGGFALGMLPEPAVRAPVLSQPSLPFGFTKKHRADLHIGPDDRVAIEDRMEADPDLCVLGLRFSDDKLSPGSRFDSLHRWLGDRFVAVEIDSSKGNPHGIPRMAHSVLTEHLVDESGHPTRDALDQVLDLFRTRLLADQSWALGEGAAEGEVVPPGAQMLFGLSRSSQPAPGALAAQLGDLGSDSLDRVTTVGIDRGQQRSGGRHEVGDDDDVGAAQKREGSSSQRDRSERHDYSRFHQWSDVVVDHTGLAGHEQHIGGSVEW